MGGAPVITAVIIGAIVLLVGGNKGALENASRNLTTSIGGFKFHSIDLGTRTFDLKVDVNFTNITQSIIPLSNLIVRINMPVGGQWRTLATSNPTGKLNIAPGVTRQEFRFKAPVAKEVFSLFGNFISGTTQQLQIEAFPQIGGANLSPVQIIVNVNPRDITTTLLSQSFGLGLVPNKGKKIKGNSDRYNRFFPSLGELKKTDPIVAQGSTYETLDQMKRIVSETLSQTAAIAKNLKRPSAEQTLKSVFKFANENFNYRLDTPGTEQLRQPLRSWADRKEGIDCDCYSILISSILTNLGISHSFRKAKYNGSKQYSHIYVIAHENGSDYVLDPVVGTWNSEHPFSSKYTEKVI